MDVFVNQSLSPALFIGRIPEYPFTVLHIRTAVHAEFDAFGQEQLTLKVAAFSIGKSDAPAGGQDPVPGQAAMPALGVKNSYHLPGTPGGSGGGGEGSVCDNPAFRYR